MLQLINLRSSVSLRSFGVVLGLVLGMAGQRVSAQSEPSGCEQARAAIEVAGLLDHAEVLVVGRCLVLARQGWIVSGSELNGSDKCQQTLSFLAASDTAFEGLGYLLMNGCTTLIKLGWVDATDVWFSPNVP